VARMASWIAWRMWGVGKLIVRSPVYIGVLLDLEECSHVRLQAGYLLVPAFARPGLALAYLAIACRLAYGLPVPR